MIAEDTRVAHELAALGRELGIKQFLISFTDLFGTARAKLVPLRAIDAMAKSGASFAGFATWLDLTPADPDMLAIPDPASLTQLPWKPEVAWLAADAWMHGKPLEQAPRNVLKRTIAAAANIGYELRSGVECEFFLLAPGGERISDPHDRQVKPCYDQGALMRRYDVIAELSDAMEALGWKPYQSDHEDANGQFEMNWEYDSALVTADRHVFFKYMVKVIAEKHGLRATFMPKPFGNTTGNGCHTHVSVWNGDRNLFQDDDGELGVSALGYAFLGGIMANARALCALLNPTVNSYKRINAPVTRSGATWSPNTVTYSGDNRTHMIRIPAPGRFELRLPDGSVNPYLLPAAILAAGMDGTVHDRSPGQRLDIDMYVHGNVAPNALKLPTNLLDALRALESSDALRDGLGERFVAAYVKLRGTEWDAYASHLSQWELETTLDC